MPRFTPFVKVLTFPPPPEILSQYVTPDWGAKFAL